MVSCVTERAGVSAGRVGTGGRKAVAVPATSCPGGESVTPVRAVGWSLWGNWGGKHMQRHFFHSLQVKIIL